MIKVQTDRILCLNVDHRLDLSPKLNLDLPTPRQLWGFACRSRLIPTPQRILNISELRKRRELGAGKSPSARPAKCSIGPKANSDILDAAPVTTAASRTPKPRAPMATRYIPAALRRDVARRDGQRCTYVAFAESRSDGARRCDAIHQLEFDHVNPRAFGGQNTLGNLCLLCRAHNNLAAKDLMGKEFIESRYRHG